MTIPVSRPHLDDNDRKCVAETLAASEISGTAGTFIPEFESAFAEYCGVPHGVATTNGTAALHLALATLSIGPEDEILVSTLTNMATFFAVLYQGAKPVPVDVEPDTWNMNPALLEFLVTPRTKAILVVHLFGHPVDMDPVLSVARKHNLFVIEDAAEAHGAEYKGKRTGSLGDIGCFSFYANKIITTGEGGMLVTRDKKYADRARNLKSLAYGNENRFMHSDIGFNYRMTNMQAALGCSQLKRIDFSIESKRGIANFYNNALRDIADLQLPVEKPYAKNVYWMFHLVLRGGFKGKRVEVMRELKEKGVETRESFIPYNMQEIFLKKGLTEQDLCPVANDIGQNGFYLPSGPVLSEQELDYTATSLKEVLDSVR